MIFVKNIRIKITVYLKKKYLHFKISKHVCSYLSTGDYPSVFTKINTFSLNFIHFTKKMYSLPAGQNTEHSTHMHFEQSAKSVQKFVSKHVDGIIHNEINGVKLISSVLLELTKALTSKR